MTDTLPALRDILPHRPPMILIDDFDYCTDTEVRCSVTIRDGAPFVVDGRVPALVSLEYFAQTVAALFGWRHRHRTGGFALGMLLGTRELALDADFFNVGDTLTITGVETWCAPPISQYRCELRKQGDAAVLARGSISVLAGGPPAGASP